MCFIGTTVKEVTYTVPFNVSMLYLIEAQAITISELQQGVTGEESHLAKMKPPKYGHSHLHVPLRRHQMVALYRVIECVRNQGAVRRTTHKIYMQTVPFGRRALCRKQASMSPIGRYVYWRRPGYSLHFHLAYNNMHSSMICLFYAQLCQLCTLPNKASVSDVT